MLNTFTLFEYVNIVNVVCLSCFVKMFQSGEAFIV